MSTYSSGVADAPEVVVRNLLRTEWDDSRTAGVTPDIHHGWLYDDSTSPEVTISNPEEDPINGGQTGFSGINAADGVPVQNISGTINVNCWSSRDRSSVNPRKLVYHMKKEVERIMNENWQGGGSDLTRLSFGGANRLVDTEEDPTMFRYQVVVGYGYDNRP